jgi:hypothetical protein
MRKGVVGGRNGEGPRFSLSPMGMVKYKKNKKGRCKGGVERKIWGMLEYITKAGWSDGEGLGKATRISLVLER